MKRRRELEHLLRAALKHDVDPTRLAVAADHWEAASGVDLLTFLIDRGALSHDDAGQMELSATEGFPVAVSDSSQDTPCPDTDGEMTTPPSARDGPFPTPVDGAVTTDDRYKIVRLYKQGGLGEIWLAKDSVIGREVALKSLRPEQAANEPAKFRFVREARITGQLEHPSIVPLYDFRESATEPFYVMRFVSGRTLAEAAVDYHRRRAKGEAGALDLNALLDAFIGVCRAVAFAHSRNILHRDLKGQNIILGEYGEVFLLDWGLAKQVTAPEDPTLGPDTEVVSSDDQMTADGSVVGTLAFMAPEVVEGGVATKKSDVYGLGAVLYVVLTGRAPYGGTTKEEVRSRVMSEAPAPVAVANPSASPALVAICTRAMAREPTARYYSADELATDVRRWLADEPVWAFEERWPARFARWTRRRRTTVVAAAVLLLTTAVATSIAALLVWNEQRRTEVARKQASDNAETALNVVHDLGRYVEKSETTGPGRVLNDQQRKVALDATLTSYQRLLTAYPEDLDVRLSVARMYRYRANLSRLLNETDAAGNAYEQARRYFKELVDAKPTDRFYRQHVAETTRDYGLFLQTLGRSGEASKLLDDSFRVYDELLFTSPGDVDLHRTVANLQLDRSDIDFQLGRFGDSERAARSAGETYAKMAAMASAQAHPLDPMFWGMADNRLALALRELKRTDEAIAAHDAAVGRLRGLIKTVSTRDVAFQLHRARTERAWTLSGVAARRTEAGAELKETIAGFESLAKQSERLPLYPRWHGTARLYRGRLLELQGQRDAAIAELTGAAMIFESLVEKHPEIPVYRGELGRTYAALGKLATNSKDGDTWYGRARKMLDEAVRRHPESVQHQQALEELNRLSKSPNP